MAYEQRTVPACAWLLQRDSNERYSKTNSPAIAQTGASKCAQCAQLNTSVGSARLTCQLRTRLVAHCASTSTTPIDEFRSMLWAQCSGDVRGSMGKPRPSCATTRGFQSHTSHASDSSVVTIFVPSHSCMCTPELTATFRVCAYLARKAERISTTSQRRVRCRTRTRATLVRVPKAHRSNASRTFERREARSCHRRAPPRPAT